MALALPTSTSQTLQQLQSQASEQGQNAMGAYFSHLGFLEFAGVVIFLVFAAAIIYFVIETGWFTTRVDRFRDIVLRSDMSKLHAQESWHRVQEHFFRGGESDLKVAILEADKLLNDAMRETGIMGLNLGDRLKRANSGQMPNINELWQAHKLRNQIAHEPNFKIKRDVAERALKIYEEGLSNLGIFDGGDPQ